MLYYRAGPIAQWSEPPLITGPFQVRAWWAHHRSRARRASEFGGRAHVFADAALALSRLHRRVLSRVAARWRPRAAADGDVLGVLDGQGRLTPVAVYDSGTWWNRWPWAGASNLDSNLPVPRSLAAIPIDWLPPGLRPPCQLEGVHVRKARSNSRGSADETAGTGTHDDGANCHDYRGHPYEEDTLAISGPGILAEFVALGQPENDAILRQLESRIATLETGELARWKGITEYKDTALTRTYMVTGRSGTRYVSTPPPGQGRDDGIRKAPPRSTAGHISICTVRSCSSSGPTRIA